jgi:quinoprotein dehydrogenase-associated probable ABC transporter substrate-binding protein
MASSGAAGHSGNESGRNMIVTNGRGIGALAGGAVALACLVVVGAAPVVAQQAPMGELVDRTALRVCADPGHLPFSNDRGEGFENKIAELMAARLGVPVAYTWYPQTLGFVRNTLNARLCDLVMGVVIPYQPVQNTNPYYHSTYVLAYRTADGPKFADLSSPAMRQARIGVVAPTPPVDLLVEHGLLGQLHTYTLPADTRIDNPGQRMMSDLAAGQIDVALVWGPIAGYWARQQPVPITLVPLESDRAGQHFDFRISMGVRHNEPDWKHAINNLIRELQPEITQTLKDYGVPLLDERGELIAGTAGAEGAAGQ